MKENVKIVQLNAGIGSNSAPNRLHLALRKIGIDTNIVTMRTNVEDESILVVKKSLFYRMIGKLDFILCRLEFSRKYTMTEGMPFSYYRTGMNISKNPVIKNADIIELHWICGSFLAIHEIDKLLKLKKPVIIICHDNWHFTGGCHVRMGCEKYKDHCSMCPQLKSDKERDCSYRLFETKRKIFKERNITVVSPSRWMDNNVAKSSLLSKYPHYIIPNVLNTDLFKPLDQFAVREKYNIEQNAIVLAYGAVNAVKTPYKGYSQLLIALDLFRKKYTTENQIVILVFGSNKKDCCQENGYEMRYLGYLEEEEMVEMYNCANVYIVPSLEDSFNYTVAESLACETPVVSFATGGIVDIIDHKKCGYLAEYNNPTELSEGIEWVLNNNIDNILGKAGREKVIKNYSEEVVAEQFFNLYQKLLDKNM